MREPIRRHNLKHGRGWSSLRRWTGEPIAADRCRPPLRERRLSALNEKQTEWFFEYFQDDEGDRCADAGTRGA